MSEIKRYNLDKIGSCDCSMEIEQDGDYVMHSDIVKYININDLQDNTAICSQCGEEIIHTGKHWEHTSGSPRHIASPLNEDKCGKCGKEKISASIKIIGFPDHHMKGAEIMYCGYCDKPPVMELNSGRQFKRTLSRS